MKTYTPAEWARIEVLIRRAERLLRMYHYRQTQRIEGAK
jgi:hypothetical protein